MSIDVLKINRLYKTENDIEKKTLYKFELIKSISKEFNDIVGNNTNLSRIIIEKVNSGVTPIEFEIYKHILKTINGIETYTTLETYMDMEDAGSVILQEDLSNIFTNVPLPYEISNMLKCYSLDTIIRILFLFKK